MPRAVTAAVGGEPLIPYPDAPVIGASPTLFAVSNAPLGFL